MPFASELDAAHAMLMPLLPPDTIAAVVAAVPDEWLENEQGPASANRQVYVDFLNTRMQSAHLFVKAAQHARSALI